MLLTWDVCLNGTAAQVAGKQSGGGVQHSTTSKSSMSLHGGEQSWSQNGASTFGCIFGVPDFVPAGRPIRWTTEPSDCEEYLAPNIQAAWVNYNKRSCIGCWNVICVQLEKYLCSISNDRAADVVGGFLLEPTMY